MEQSHESFLSDPRAWVAVAFVIFFLIFGKKLWVILAGMLDKHADAIRAELDEAARLRHEAEAMLADATVQREAALRAADEMLSRARDEAARVGEAARAEAAGAAARRERLALDRIAAAEKAALTDVQTAAADLAARAAVKVIEREFTADADSHAIDHAIQGLPVALGARRAA